MKRAFAIGALLTVAAACDQLPTTPARLIAGHASSAAAVETILKGRFPIGPRTAFNDCTNEYVDIAGEYNLVVRQVTTPTGSVHFMIHSVAGHVTGIGQTSETKYVSNEHMNYVEHWDGPNYVLVLEFGISTVTKGQETNNAPGKLQIVTVIDANGIVRVDRLEVRFECQS